MAKRGKRAGVLETAMRGAAAGMVGGLAVSLVEREVLSRLAGVAPHRTEWDDTVSRALAGMGLGVEGRGRIAAGVGSQVLFAGLLGAAYAVAQEQARESRAGRALVDGVMAYAASLVFPEVAAPRRKGARRGARRRLAPPVSTAAAFSRVTSMAFGALAR